MSVIVIEFITLDGIVSDRTGPGARGRRLGVPAWPRDGRRRQVPARERAGQRGHAAGAQHLAAVLAAVAGRDNPFSVRMNAVPKLVASRTLTDTSAWANSRVIEGDLAETVKREPRDVIITGSLSVVHALMAGDLIDEYRLLVFPTILGTGERLFPAGGPPAYLESLSAERTGAAILTRYARAAG